MRVLKQNPILRLVNSYLVDSPQPVNISYLWNFGSLLALCLGIQILTGVFLVMHYTPQIDLAFNSVEHIMRDVNYGWVLRYTHANVASFFFIFVYAHMARGIYYNSYKSPRVAPWTIGVIILILMMGTAFLGYCLVMGQMSLWGATVITNLLSAIPWIGVDFVEFKNFIFNLNSLLIISCLIYYIKHGVNKYFLIMSNLNTIGSVNVKGLRGQKTRSEEDKAYALNIPYSFLSMLMGLIDGDGYISITNSNGYIRIQLIISLDISELNLLNYIQSVLKIGRVNVYPNFNNVKYTISRVDLQEILFPLIIFHNLFFLTDTRRSQFNLAFYILQNNLNMFSNITNLKVPSFNTLPTTALDYTLLPFFLNWIVGFTISEGSFYNKNNGDFCFSLRQRSHFNLFEAFKIVFNTQVKIYNDTEYLMFVVSSKKDIQTVVNFFSSSNLHPLLGNKLIQYNKWLEGLKNSTRYCNIQFPF
jgi:hypothetical protein